MGTIVRSTPERRAKPIRVKANFFKFNLQQAQQSYLEKYSVTIQPFVPESNQKFRELILRKAQPSLASQVGRWVFANTAVYTVRQAEVGTVTAQATVEAVDYTIVCEPTGRVNTPEEHQAFFNKFFNSVLAKLCLVRIGRKFYDNTRAANLKQHQLELWPGYASSVHSLAGGCYVNIDISYRCLRTLTVLDQLKEIQQRPRSDPQIEFSRLVVDALVITRYNNRCYRVAGVAWDMTPQNTFMDASAAVLTFVEYYGRRWKQRIMSEDQPMLRCVLRDRECFLVPELCVITGLPDDLRKNFTVMRDLASHTKSKPSERLQQSIGLITSLSSHSGAQCELGDWRANISAEPVIVDAHVLEPATIRIADNITFTADDSGNFDRNVQKKMFEQPPLRNWAILVSRQDHQFLEILQEEVQGAMKTFNMWVGKPNVCTVGSARWTDWERVITEVAKPSLELMLCILPGQRGSSPLYDSLKRLTFSQLPVPTQVILTGTLKRDRGRRSVINKLMIQINAKLGGVPWVLENMPLTQTPTMIIGLDIFHKKGGYSVLGICGTIDKHFSKYVSVPAINSPNEEIIARLNASVIKLLHAFRDANNAILPKRVVVFRDGVSDSQRTVVEFTEVPQFKQAFSDIYSDQELPELVYIVVNKRTNARFYQERNSDNPPLGTVVNTTVTLRDKSEFFLMPTRANQGTMTPTHFHIVFNNSACSSEDLELLTYKLCYAYFNWSGSIRVPAPCQYAHKLAYTYGERADPRGPPIPHAHWEKTKALYFL